MVPRVGGVGVEQAEAAADELVAEAREPAALSRRERLGNSAGAPRRT